MADVMLDIETFSTKPNAVILTFGAVKFDPYSDSDPSDAMYVKLNVDDQIVMNRDVDENTLEWWSKQDPEVYEEATSEDDRIELIDFTKQLNKFLVGSSKIWAQGAVFDITIIENLYNQLGVPAPWAYWQIKDSRTIFDTFNDPRKEFLSNNAHNALADAYAQAKAIQKVFGELGLHRQ